MNIESFRNFCLSLAHVTEELPFDENTLVFKVKGKMFALCDLNNFVSINVKCDPEKAVALRDAYHCVQPGYHMNKKHWNTILINQDMPDVQIYTWVSHSYQLVWESLPKKVREEGFLG